MARAFEADPLQEALIYALVNSGSIEAGLNGSGTGVGKTYCAIRVGVGRGAKRVLIIGQPKVFENFEETLEILTGEKLLPVGNSKFRSTPAAEAQANKAACMAGKPGWYFVSRELFQREMWRTRDVQHRNGKVSKKTEMIHSWDKLDAFDFVVYDESQMAASATAKSTKSARAIRTDFLLFQSGDWFGGEIANQYHVATTLWPDWMEEQYSNMIDWRDENCTTVYDHFAFDKKAISGEKWPGFFASSLPLYVRIPSPIDKPKPEQYFIDLSPRERKLYTDLKKNLAAEIRGELFIVDDHKTLYMRLREATLGEFRPATIMRRNARTGEEFEGQTVEYVAGDKSSTVDGIREIMRDHPGEPIIVLTHSRKFANKAAIDLGGLAYTGSQTDAQKAEAERAFKAGEVKVLVGTEAMCEGLDGLQHMCHIGVIASRPGKSYMTGQFIGRVARRGQEHEVLFYELVRRDTLDTFMRKQGKITKGIIERAVTKELMLTGAKALPGSK